VTVDENGVSNQAKDPATTEVKVEIPAVTEANPQVSAKLQAGALNTVAQSSKPLVIKSGNTEVSVPNSVLKGIAAVSATYDFTITASRATISALRFTFSLTSVERGEAILFRL